MPRHAKPARANGPSQKVLGPQGRRKSAQASQVDRHQCQSSRRGRREPPEGHAMQVAVPPAWKQPKHSNNPNIVNARTLKNI